MDHAVRPGAMIEHQHRRGRVGAITAIPKGIPLMLRCCCVEITLKIWPRHGEIEQALLFPDRKNNRAKHNECRGSSCLITTLRPLGQTSV